jgi:hypothetical protein
MLATANKSDPAPRVPPPRFQVCNYVLTGIASVKFKSLYRLFQRTGTIPLRTLESPFAISSFPYYFLSILLEQVEQVVQR